jgi:hypothetical protein
LVPTAASADHFDVRKTGGSDTACDGETEAIERRPAASKGGRHAEIEDEAGLATEPGSADAIAEAVKDTTSTTIAASA